MLKLFVFISMVYQCLFLFHWFTIVCVHSLVYHCLCSLFLLSFRELKQSSDAVLFFFITVDLWKTQAPDVIYIFIIR